MPVDRLKRWAAFLFPILLAIYLYRRSFRIWFLADDFAWLGLSLSIEKPSDLLGALFSPMAQGTVRTLSERLFFLVFERTFGMESLPMRLAAFATFLIGLVFLILLIEKLAGNLWTGMLAAILWSLNFGVTAALNWISSYNQILLATLFLSAFYFFLKFFDTGRRTWLWGCWLAYLLGFGALESIIVFPAVLLLWAVLFRRNAIQLTLPFFAPALLFACAHLFWIPKAQDATAYRMHLDASILETVSIYWQWLFASARLINFDPVYAWMIPITSFVLTPALLLFLLWRTFRKDYLPLFLTLLSLALIAPMLPLREHRTDYYLASASFGIISMLALIPFRVGGPARILGLVLIAIYVYPSFILQQASIEWYLDRTAPLRPLMRGLENVTKLHPGKLILLEGITQSVFDSSIADDALRLLPHAEIRLVPGSVPHDSPLVLAPTTARTAFEKESAIVYRFNGVKLIDVTSEWESTKALTLNSGLSPEILASDPAFSPQFLSGWYGIEDSHRWMAAKSQVRLGGPFSATSRLSITAYAPPQLNDFELGILLNGSSIYKAKHGPGPLELSIPVPAAFTNSQSLVVELRSSKTVRPPNDGRDLSIVVTRIAIR